MMQINNDGAFQAALKKLDGRVQRVAAARFIEHVLPLSGDTKLAHVVEIAGDHNASRASLNEALKIAKSSAIHCRARDGIEGDWHRQAGYFVARAAIAALSPRCQVPEGIAWHAALNSRLARTSEAIDHGYNEDTQEREYQYAIVAGFINIQSETAI